MGITVLNPPVPERRADSSEVFHTCLGAILDLPEFETQDFTQQLRDAVDAELGDGGMALQPILKVLYPKDSGSSVSPQHFVQRVLLTLWLKHEVNAEKVVSGFLDAATRCAKRLTTDSDGYFSIQQMVIARASSSSTDDDPVLLQDAIRHSSAGYTYSGTADFLVLTVMGLDEAKLQAGLTEEDFQKGEDHFPWWGGRRR